jgi:hypothetical protein
MFKLYILGYYFTKFYQMIIDINLPRPIYIYYLTYYNSIIIFTSLQTFYFLLI